MDYREPQSNASTVGRILRRWAREFIFEDWGLKLLALGITLALWFAVTLQRAPATIRLRGIQLVFILPSEMEISNVAREEIEITLAGNRHAFERINVRNLVASVDISSYKPGERVVKLSPEKIDMELPEGVRIEDVEPSLVPLRIEPRIEREVDVEARLEGEPAAGYELREVVVSPARIRVRGPASQVGSLKKVLTETISLSGRTESFLDSQIAVDILNPKIVTPDAFVAVRVELNEKRAEKRFADVKLVQEGAVQSPPARVGVTLAGPVALLEQLRAEEITLTNETPESPGAPRYRLSLPAGFEGRVELRGVQR